MMVAGAILALQPVFTVISERVVLMVWPGTLTPEPLGAIKWVGIGLVICGVFGFSARNSASQPCREKPKPDVRGHRADAVCN